MNSRHLLLSAILTVCLGFFGAPASVLAQSDFNEDFESKPDKFYMSHGGEMIFSWSQTEHPTSSDGVVLRWAPVFNFQTFANYDFANAFGLMGGLSIRNTGYIYKFNAVVFDDDDVRQFRKKFRTYNLGIPLGLKVGNMEKFFLYAGYEFEFPFHYKEKTFDFNGGNKRKFTAWFTDRVERVQQSFFVGIQTGHGFNVKFKYYLTEFHNQDFTTTTGDEWPASGDPSQPYKGLKSNVFYISVSTIIDKRTYSRYKSKDWWDWDDN